MRGENKFNSVIYKLNNNYKKYNNLLTNQYESTSNTEREQNHNFLDQINFTSVDEDLLSKRYNERNRNNLFLKIKNIKRHILSQKKQRNHSEPIKHFSKLKRKTDYLNNSNNPLNKNFNNTKNSIKKNNYINSDFNNLNKYFQNDVNYIILNKTINSVDFKNKELIHLNNILQNQNKDLRQSVRILNNKVRILSNENKTLVKNQKEILIEKNKLLKQISLFENEFKMNKNILLKKLEQKTKMVQELNKEKMQLYNIIEQKNYLIKKIKKINPNNTINKDLFNEEESEKNYEKNELLSKIFELKNELDNIKEENEKLKQNLSPENDDETLKEEIKKYKYLYFKLYHEKENMKNNLSNNQENINRQNQNKINELITKLNSISKENNNLRQIINNKNIKENDLFHNQLKIKQSEIINLKNKNEILQKNTEKMQREIEQRKNQTSTLQSDIINLKAQIKDLATASLSTSNKKTDNTEQMNKFLKQRYRENADLNNVVLNLKAQISELENEQHNYVLQISKIQKLEKHLNEAKKENETNFNELRNKQSENIKLMQIIKNKDKQIENLQNKLKEQPINNKMDSSLFVKTSENNTYRSEDLNEKYSKLVQENAILKEKIKSMKNEQEDGLILTIDNLKEELKDKNLQINSLIKENNTLRNFNKRYPEGSFVKVDSKELNDQEKINLYKEQIKELKLINDSDYIQIKALKEVIKDSKNKLKLMKTFNGQLKDINEFVELFNTAMTNYKPKKTEQKNAFNKLIQIMNNLNL